LGVLLIIEAFRTDDAIWAVLGGVFLGIPGITELVSYVRNCEPTVGREQ
jgi:hypothetical protein